METTRLSIQQQGAEQILKHTIDGKKSISGSLFTFLQKGPMRLISIAQLINIHLLIFDLVHPFDSDYIFLQSPLSLFYYLCLLSPAHLYHRFNVSYQQRILGWKTIPI